MSSLTNPGSHAMQTIDWYFDFISPFAYLQWQAVRDWQRPVRYRPLLFAGLLEQMQHKGPAEIPQKRLFTYRHVAWRAARAGIPLVFPPAHPFNPLAALRLCVAAGATREAVDALFNHFWREGLAGDTWEELAPVARRLGLEGPPESLVTPEVKATLRANFDDAAAAGLFGVPSLVINGQVFWGDDATGLAEAYLDDPTLFDSPEMRRLAELPIGAARPGAK